MFGLPVILYLFLGGAGAGLFVVLAARELAAGWRRPPSDCRHLEGEDCVWGRNGYMLAFVLTLSGSLSLMADLGRPQSAYLVFVFPHMTYITWGSYALALLMGCSAALAVRCVCPHSPIACRLSVWARWAGLLASCYIVLYTGLFLQGMAAVPFWDSPALPSLFAASSLSVGAVLALASRPQPHPAVRAAGFGARSIGRIDGILIVLEALCTVAHMVLVSADPCARESVGRLLRGDQSLLFWLGFVGCGIVIPLVCRAVRLHRGGTTCVGPVEVASVILGGFCLRMAFVNAGVHVAG